MNRRGLTSRVETHQSAPAIVNNVVGCVHRNRAPAAEGSACLSLRIAARLGCGPDAAAQQSFVGRGRNLDDGAPGRSIRSILWECPDRKGWRLDDDRQEASHAMEIVKKLEDAVRACGGLVGKGGRVVCRRRGEGRRRVRAKRRTD